MVVLSALANDDNTNATTTTTITTTTTTTTTKTFYILQRRVQWKQGVVICMVLYTILLDNTTPIHWTPLPLHPPVMNTIIVVPSALAVFRFLFCRFTFCRFGTTLVLVRFPLSVLPFWPTHRFENQGFEQITNNKTNQRNLNTY